MCFFCRTEVDLEHKCFILTEQENYERNKKSVKSCVGYIFFDYEAMQSETSHEVNLVCARKICIGCINKMACLQEDCGDHYWHTNSTFCSWLFNDKNKHFIAIAHNMKAYDGYFIMNYIVNNIKPNERLPEIVLNGSKILVINFANVTIKDSINFVPMALSKFPKTFGLSELKKGFFPHFFNIKENQNYIGKYPPPESYGYKFMSVEDSKKFLLWYKDQDNKIFNLQEELLLYCQSDVDILAKACLCFRSLFIEITKQSIDDLGVDPFSQCLTMPAACHYVFRRNFMKANTIALIPPNGYNTESTSYKATLWLQHISLKKNIYIQHARNSKEKRIDDFKVDGWDPENKTVYEFHGCPKCYYGDSYNSLKNELMSTTYTKHLDRINKIKNNAQVLVLVEIWECEYDKLYKEDEEFNNYVKNQGELRPRLEPRNALAGGRTNAIVLHHVGRMGYVDFTSLYPFIQKYGEFPIGHPEIITENFESLEKYFGLIYCRVLPPCNLYIPTLPYKINNKLLFPLCGACARDKVEKCFHDDKGREFEGTFVILEILEAIKMGYRVVKIFEIWNFTEKAKYNPITKTGGLFTDYVNTFLRIKQEASGYPRWVKNEQDKEKYINDYLQHEGIQLEKDNIKENPGLKALSKLLLNSQWGRYAMNTDKTKCKFVKNPFELNNILYNDQFEVKDILFPSDHIAICYYKEKVEMHWVSNQTNVVLAAFVTAQARLKLYSELIKFGRNVVYFDTDSIIYIKGGYEPTCGDYLGMFTNEIDPNEGTEIIEFASAGPKNYSYKLDTGITHTKVKGFSLNYASSKFIDFEKIKSIVSSKDDTTESIEQNTITRNKKNWTVQTKTFNKMYRQVYDKRVIKDDLTTVPFGYLD